MFLGKYTQGESCITHVSHATILHDNTATILYTASIEVSMEAVFKHWSLISLTLLMVKVWIDLGKVT